MTILPREVAAARGGLLDKAREGLPFADTLIIDDHCHIGPCAEFWIPNASVEEMIMTMDRVGEDVACVSHYIAINPDYRRGNELVSAALREHPDRLIGFGVVNPNYDDDIVPELRRCFSELGMSGIKLHPEFHDYPIDGPKYEPVFEFAEERRLPILSHTYGGPTDGSPRLSLAPDFLEELSSRYPHVTFVIGHGFNWEGRKPNLILDLVKERSNVFLDSAWSVMYNGVVESIVHYVGADKILYGSDFPYCALRPQLGKIIYAKISDDEKRRILGINISKILRLDTRREFIKRFSAE